MNNLLSYYGLVDTGISVSDKDLSVRGKSLFLYNVPQRPIIITDKEPDKNLIHQCWQYFFTILSKDGFR